ncbi:MAG: hypothetical protein FWE05_08125 [Defluviitaleaceae bacterium]|nr:hypothetical protein [Defluviitaleaceae bacterium]
MKKRLMSIFTVLLIISMSSVAIHAYEDEQYGFYSEEESYDSVTSLAESILNTIRQAFEDDDYFIDLGDSRQRISVNDELFDGFVMFEFHMEDGSVKEEIVYFRYELPFAGQNARNVPYMIFHRESRGWHNGRPFPTHASVTAQYRGHSFSGTLTIVDYFRIPASSGAYMLTWEGWLSRI